MNRSAMSTPMDRSLSRWTKTGLLLLLTVVLSVLISRHVEGMKGPWYGKIGWRSLRPLYAYGWMGAATLPWIAAILLHEWRGRRIDAVLLIPLMMVSVMA